MKRMVLSIIGMLAMVGVTATSALALPFGDVSINGAQFMFGSHLFQTAAGSSDVGARFIDSSTTATVADFPHARLVVTPIDFTGGITVGTGGGFSIYNGATLLLSGTFGDPSALGTIGANRFESSIVISFVNPLVIPLDFSGTSSNPGLFSATLGNVNLANSSWTTRDAATAQISSAAPAPVPEPATLLLLGSGLIGLSGLGFWRRKNTHA